MSARNSGIRKSQGSGQHLSGIIVIDRLPPEPRPRVQAFVWCKRYQTPALPDGKRTMPAPATLMVGLATEVNGTE